MANKYLALQKEVFDISKVTVVGNPTITSDGVASGFGSHSEMIKTIKASELLNKSWTIKVVCNGKGGSLGNPISFTTSYGNTNSGGIQSAYSPAHLYLNLKTGDSVDTAQLAFNNTYSMVHIPQEYRSKDIVITLSFNMQTGTYTWSLRGVNDVVDYKTITYTPTSTNKQLYEITTNTDAYIAINSTLANVNYNADELYDLNSFKIYVDGQLVFQPVKPTYLLERRKPKVWNKGQFAVVGNPSISDDGVASGFSGSDYLRVPYRPLGQNFKIFTPKFNSTDVSQTQKIVRYSDGNIRIEIYQNKIRLYRYSGNNVYDLPVGKTTLQNNTDYYYYVEQTTDGTNYYLKGYISTDGTNWVLDIDKTYSTAMHDYQNNAPIQISGADALQPFLGTLNPKYFKIYTDNNLVFDGGAYTYVYDTSKFTVVGTPTITSDGVASGFSTANYIKTSGFNIGQLKGKSWEIKCKWYFDVKTTDTYNINDILNLSETYQSNGYMGANTNIKTLRIMITTGVTGASQIFYQDSTSIAESGWVEQKLTFDVNTGTYTFYNLKPNSTTWESREWVATTENKELLVINERPSDCFQIGRGKEAIIGHTPVILPSISITSDGKEVFTGAKENYYMLRG